MASSEHKRERTRAIPRKNNPLLPLSAILLIAGGAAQLVLGLMPLQEISLLWVQNVPSFSFLVAGALLWSSRTQPTHYVAALPVLMLGSLGLRGGGGLPVLLALALMLASAIGLRLNVTISTLPKPIRIPVLNLAAVVLTLLGMLHLLSGWDFQWYWGYLLKEVTEAGLSPFHLVLLILSSLLLFAGILLLNLSVEPQTVDGTASLRDPRLRLQSVPQQDSIPFSVGAALLIAGGAWRVYYVLILGNLIRYTGLAALQVVFMLAAGFLLVNRSWQKKHYFPAMVLLFLSSLSNVYWQPLGLVPVLLMLLSATGMPWNVAPDTLPNKLRVPVLNLVAAALLAAVGLDRILTALRRILQATDPLTQLGSSMKSLAPILILTVGAILLNLHMDSQVVQKGVQIPDGAKYKKGFSSLVQRCYRDVGGNLQKLARIQGIICLVIAILAAAIAVLGAIGFALCSILDFGQRYTYLTLLLAGGGSMLVALIGVMMTWPLYAFGQMTSDVRHLKDTGVSMGTATPGGPVSPAAEDNPDELPEL